MGHASPLGWRVNLVAFGNGVGNSRDIVLLAAALRQLGCVVTVTAVSKWERRRRKLAVVRALAAWRIRRRRRQPGRAGSPRYDLTLMMEHIWPERAHLARRNVSVPNPEFFDRHDQALLRWMDAVWAKTATTARIFQDLGAVVVPTGFDADDHCDPAIEREPDFFHLAGASRMKGTSGLLALWGQHPEWPRLTVLQSAARRVPLAATNVVIETRYLTDAELTVEQNRHLFHVCLSETEGWGHYIAEAQGIGAIVLTTDAGPMNELVSADRGVLVSASAKGRQNLATTYDFDASALQSAVARVLEMPAEEQQRLRAQARAWFEDNKLDFPQRLRRAIEALA